MTKNENVLPTVDVVEQLTPEQLPALVAQLAALLAAASARMMVCATSPPVVATSDVLLDVTEAAEVAGRSVSWMRKHGPRLPGFVQPGGHGTRARWSRRALEQWATPLASHTPGSL